MSQVHDATLLRLYAALLCAAAIVLAACLVVSGYEPPLWLPTLVLAGFALLSEKQSVRLTPNLQVSVAFLPGLFATVAFGPLAGMIVAALGLLGDLGRPWERWFVWTGSRCIVYGLAGVAGTAVAGGMSPSGLLLAAAVACVATVVGETLFGAVTLVLRGSGSPRVVVVSGLRFAIFGMLVYVPVIAGLIYVYNAAGLSAVFLFAGPAVAAQRFFVLYQNQTRTSEELSIVVDKLERVHLSFATALVTALDARDHYTAGHSAAVAVYSRDTARCMGLSEGDQNKAHLCGLLHDIGKIGVASGLLEKGGPLTNDERCAVEMHSEIGGAILDRVEGYEDIADAVRHHHERFDGQGYPGLLARNAIPVLSRIVAVADSYSAMTSERPYRQALSSTEAILRLEHEAGRQFDPRIVDVFLQLLAGASEDYARAREEDFESALRALAHASRTAHERHPALVAV